MEDLISYRTEHNTGSADSDPEVVISDESLFDTQKALAPNFQGAAICAWGLNDFSTDRFIAFPPQGAVAHYKLIQTNGQVRFRFIEVSRIP